MKKCTKCKKEKELEDFPNDRNKKDGRYPSCKDCYRERMGSKKRLPPHPDSSGYMLGSGGVRLHRLVMEKFLGRKLSFDEHVHHKNGNKLDNRLENLEVLAASEHHREHYIGNKEFHRGASILASALKYGKIDRVTHDEGIVWLRRIFKEPQ